MASKVKSLKLSDGHAPSNPSEHTTAESWRNAERYRVEQITDSVEYRTGQLLERTEVEPLCASNSWRITIVPIN
jgi:hypothetical protein